MSADAYWAGHAAAGAVGTVLACSEVPPGRIADEVGVDLEEVVFWQQRLGTPPPGLLDPLARAAGVDAGRLFAAVGLVPPDGGPPFGTRLRDARGDRTQDEVARAIGTVASTVSLWERGGAVPPTDVVLRLAAVLNVVPAVLLAGLAVSHTAAQAGPEADVRDPAWLLARLVGDGMSLGEIAAETGVHENTVRSARDRAGIPGPGSGRSGYDRRLADRGWIVSRYRDRGWTVRALAGELGLSLPQVSAWLAFHQVALRPEDDPDDRRLMDAGYWRDVAGPGCDPEVAASAAGVGVREAAAWLAHHGLVGPQAADWVPVIVDPAADGVVGDYVNRGMTVEQVAHARSVTLEEVRRRVVAAGHRLRPPRFEALAEPWLRHAHLVEGRTVREIARMRAVSPSTVTTALRRYGISRTGGRPGTRTVDRCDLVAVALRGLTRAEAAAELGVSVPTVAAAARTYGIGSWPRRGKTEPDPPEQAPFTGRDLIVEHHHQRRTTREIAKRHGVDRAYVRRAMQVLGVDLLDESRWPRTIDRDDLTEAVAEAADRDDVIGRLGTTPSTLARAAEHYGIALPGRSRRPRGRPARFGPDELAAAHRDGLSVAEAAEAYGVSKSVVYRTQAASDLTLPRPDRHPLAVQGRPSPAELTDLILRDGRSPASIAAEHGVTRQAVDNWIKAAGLGSMTDIRNRQKARLLARVDNAVGDDADDVARRIRRGEDPVGIAGCYRIDVDDLRVWCADRGVRREHTVKQSRILDLLPADALRYLYEDCWLGSGRIADRVGCGMSAADVTWALGHHGIATRDRYESVWDHHLTEALLTTHLVGMAKTPVELAEELGTTAATIRVHADRHGIDVDTTRPATMTPQPAEPPAIADPDAIRLPGDDGDLPPVRRVGPDTKGPGGLTPNLLRSLFNDGVTVPVLAEDRGILPQTVRRLARQWRIGIPDGRLDGRSRRSAPADTDPVISRDLLVELHHHDGLSLAAIARRTGLPYDGIRQAARIHGVDVLTRTRTAEEYRRANSRTGRGWDPLGDLDWLRGMYVHDGQSRDDIALVVGRPRSAVTRALRRAGVPVRRYAADWLSPQRIDRLRSEGRSDTWIAAAGGVDPADVQRLREDPTLLIRARRTPSPAGDVTTDG